jgi:hypothetical protein
VVGARDALSFDEAAQRELRYIFGRGHFAAPHPANPSHPVHPEQPDEVSRAGRTHSELFDRCWTAAATARDVDLLEPHAGEAQVRAVTARTELPLLDGLCLSGGGIRSACFCLGVLEALAARGLLSKFHYVSSVSGGGYIAGWLAAWSYRHRNGIRGVEAALQAAATRHAAPLELQHLFRYVTYLAPRGGLLSADLWGLLCAYLRNLAVTLAVTLPVVLILAALPYLVALGMLQMRAQTVVAQLAGLLSALTVTGTGLCMRILGDARNPAHVGFKSQLTPGFAVLATLLGGLSYAFTVLAGGLDGWLQQVSIQLNVPALLTVGICAFVFALLMVLLGAGAGLHGWWRGQDRLGGFKSLTWRASRSSVHCSVFALSAALALVLLILLEPLLQSPPVAIGGAATAVRSAFLAITGAPLLWSIAVLGSQSFMQAILSGVLDDSDREWMARFLGLCLTTSISWAVLCVVSYWLPLVIELLGPWWFGTSVLAAMAMVHWRAADRLPAIATMIATALAFTAVGWLVFRHIGAHATAASAPLLQVADLAVYCLALAVGAATFDRLVNVNRFSLHALYRDRLVRTFLGASRPPTRRGASPHPTKENAPVDEITQFTGRNASLFHDFDPADNPRLLWLRSGAWRADARHWMPVFLFNAALNRTWGTPEPGRSAKAFSFVFSAFCCGSRTTGYCDTADYVARAGGVTLGTAMATSGAALSSRTGRYDNRLLAFFLTIFNLRLGWWLGNPNNKRTRERPGPSFSLTAYLAELFGRPVSDRKWIHLSDGGHFENLGALELMRRGCRRIVSIDGSQDGKCCFDDLAHLVRLAREELNVTIEPVSNIRIGPRDMGTKGRYAALFELRYPQGRPGRLLYIKPAYYVGTEFSVPIEVQNYAMAQDAFPHEPTMDQFFSSAQFDAYRRLGQHQVQSILSDTDDTDCELRDLFEQALRHTAG